MANEQNLKRFGKEKPAPTSEEAKKAGSKGGKKSAEARAEAKTTREIAKMLDSLAVTGKNKEVLEQLGVPDDDQTQQTVRLVALHKKAMTGDVAAIKLWLEITGEAPTQKVSVEVNDDTREAYEKAAAAIKGKKGKGSSTPMTFDQVIWTDKMRAVFSDTAPVIHLVGSMGTSKTLVGGLTFFDRIMNAPANVNQFAIIGVSSVLVKRNFVDKADSLYNIHKGLCTEYSDGNKDAAGSHFCIKTKTGKKIVYIAGADNKTSYTNILSLDLGGILLDELSALHPDVIREAYGRVQRLAYPGWLITTTNGGNPAQEFYTELVNHATVQFRDTVPKIELDEMIEDRPDEHYYHFNLIDDCPHKTKEQTERLINSYPVGSFYHFSKILGCRGYSEGAMYALLLNDVETVSFGDLNLRAFEEVVATVDVGASVNGDDDSKSHTIVHIGGYTRNYHRVVPIASKKINSIEHRDIIEEAENWLYTYWLKFYGKFKAILIDKADYKLVSTWQNHSRWRGTVSVLGCVKTHKTLCPDLVARAGVKCQLMMKSKQYPTSRIVWCDEDMLKAHRQILKDKDGSELDQADVWQDYADCFSYLILWRIARILADETDRVSNKIKFY